MTSLTWEGCVNVRDLGGLPTEDGRRTRLGGVVRSDNVRRPISPGWVIRELSLGWHARRATYVRAGRTYPIGLDGRRSSAADRDEGEKHELHEKGGKRAIVLHFPLHQKMATLTGASKRTTP